jgi:hypothetical protein
MSFLELIQYGAMIGLFLGLLQFIISKGKTEALKSEASGGDYFATRQGLIIPGNLVNDFPEAIEVIRSNLASDEIVHQILQGSIGLYAAVFIATNKRVFRINKTNKSILRVTYPTEVKVFNYSDLSNLIYIKNATISSVKIITKSGHEFEIKVLNSYFGDLFSEFVKEQLENQIKHVNKPADLSITRMLRIGKNGEDLGEMTVKKVKLLLAAGQLELSDFYWDDQLNEWIQLSSCEVIN